MEVGFAIPEPLDRVSGGYKYDRAVMRALSKGGVRLTPVPLPEGFPAPSSDALAETARRLAAWPGPLLIDGLAHGAFPADLAAAMGPRAVSLVHHPLALETGLSPERAASLRESERRALAAARAVLCTSAHTRDLLISEFGVAPHRVTVAEPGVSRPPRFASCTGAPPLILAVGAPSPRKNFPLLVEALGRLRDLDWRLEVLGPAGAEEDETALRSAAETAGVADRVRRSGPVDDPTERYLAADVFVSAALYEGYGMAAAEAIAAGLPVVAISGGAMADTAATGVLVAPGPAVAERLAAAIRPLLASPSARREAAAASRHAARSLPEWRSTAAIVRKVLFLRLLGGRRSVGRA